MAILIAEKPKQGTEPAFSRQASGKHIPDKDASDLICLSLISAILFVFLPVVWFPFVNYDDASYVFMNSNVTTGLNWENIKWAFTTLNGDISYWHPLTWLSHQLDCQLFGVTAGPAHLINLILHTINSILLFYGVKRIALIARRKSDADTGFHGRRDSGRFESCESKVDESESNRDTKCAALVAAWFALHPLHVESVVWIAERKDVLSTLFFLLSIGAYFSYLDRRTPLRYCKLVALYLLALLSKPSVVTLPFVLLLLDVWPLGRISLTRIELICVWRCVREKLLLFCMTIGASIVTFLGQRDIGAVQSLDGLSLANRIDNALVAYSLYLKKLIWPADLSVIYMHPGSWPGILVIASAFVFFLLCFLAISKRKRPYLFVGWFWYVGILVPVIGLVQVGAQSMADRYTYISYVGLFVGITWLARDLLLNASLRVRRICFGVACLSVLACGLRTSDQLKFWQNSDTLFAQALRVDPLNSIAHNNLAGEMERLGNDASAEEHYRAALQRNPGFGLAHFGLAELLTKEGLLAEASQHFAMGLQDRQCIFPERGRSGLAYALTLSGNIPHAIEQYELAVDVQPNVPMSNYNLASILAMHPDAEFRDGDRAVLLAKRASDLAGGKSPSYLNLLAAAYAEAGRFPDAIRTAEQAIVLARQQKRTALAEHIEHRLNLYRENKPFHFSQDVNWKENLASWPPTAFEQMHL